MKAVSAEGVVTGRRLLEVRDLSIRSREGELVSSVDFELAAGRRLGIVGETGSGKSLTCRAVLGALERKGLTATGSVLVQGQDVFAMSPGRRRRMMGRTIGFVPQSSLNSLDPVMRVGSQIRETVKQFGCSGREADGRARELLNAVELRDVDRVLRSYPHQLSGGMRQRVMIALGMAGRPELLIADEPTTALDVTVQHKLLALLVGLCESEGMALMLVTHDLGVVEDVCDDVLVMYAGQSMERGPVGTVFADPAHPYTRALLAARPTSADGAGSRRLAGLPGRPPAPGTRHEGCRFVERCPVSVDTCSTGEVVEFGRDSGHGVRCVHFGGGSHGAATRGEKKDAAHG
ncbi:ABC transporter ATP-binding protein [Streptomyces sp. NPDC055607]